MRGAKVGEGDFESDTIVPTGMLKFDARPVLKNISKVTNVDSGGCCSVLYGAQICRIDLDNVARLIFTEEKGRSPPKGIILFDFNADSTGKSHLRKRN